MTDRRQRSVKWTVFLASLVLGNVCSEEIVKPCSSSPCRVGTVCVDRVRDGLYGYSCLDPSVRNATHLRSPRSDFDPQYTDTQNQDQNGPSGDHENVLNTNNNFNNNQAVNNNYQQQSNQPVQNNPVMNINSNYNPDYLPQQNQQYNQPPPQPQPPPPQNNFNQNMPPQPIMNQNSNMMPGNQMPFNNQPINNGPPPFNNGPINNGPMNNGPMNNGPMNNGPMNNGPINSGPINNGPMNNGPINSGPINNGPMNSGPINNGPPLNNIPPLVNQQNLPPNPNFNPNSNFNPMYPNNQGMRPPFIGPGGGGGGGGGGYRPYVPLENDVVNSGRGRDDSAGTIGDKKRYGQAAVTVNPSKIMAMDWDKFTHKNLYQIQYDNFPPGRWPWTTHVYPFLTTPPSWREARDNNYPNYNQNQNINANSNNGEYFYNPAGCASSPCQNNGECTSVGLYSYKCKCGFSYYGHLCQHRNFGSVLGVTLGTIIPVATIGVVIAVAAVCFLRSRRASGPPKRIR